MEVREVLRHLRAAAPITAIQDATGLNRRTIMRYRSWAQTQG